MKRQRLAGNASGRRLGSNTVIRDIGAAKGVSDIDHFAGSDVRIKERRRIDVYRNIIVGFKCIKDIFGNHSVGRTVVNLFADCKFERNILRRNIGLRNRSAGGGVVGRVVAGKRIENIDRLAGTDVLVGKLGRSDRKGDAVAVHKPREIAGHIGISRAIVNFIAGGKAYRKRFGSNTGFRGIVFGHELVVLNIIGVSDKRVADFDIVVAGTLIAEFAVIGDIDIIIAENAADRTDRDIGICRAVVHLVGHLQAQDAYRGLENLSLLIGVGAGQLVVAGV